MSAHVTPQTKDVLNYFAAKNTSGYWSLTAEEQRQANGDFYTEQITTHERVANDNGRGAKTIEYANEYISSVGDYFSEDYKDNQLLKLADEQIKLEQELKAIQEREEEAGTYGDPLSDEDLKRREEIQSQINDINHTSGGLAKDEAVSNAAQAMVDLAAKVYPNSNTDENFEPKSEDIAALNNAVDIYVKSECDRFRYEYPDFDASSFDENELLASADPDMLSVASEEEIDNWKKANYPPAAYAYSKLQSIPNFETCLNNYDAEHGIVISNENEQEAEEQVEKISEAETSLAENPENNSEDEKPDPYKEWRINNPCPSGMPSSAYEAMCKAEVNGAKANELIAVGGLTSEAYADLQSQGYDVESVLKTMEEKQRNDEKEAETVTETADVQTSNVKGENPENAKPDPYAAYKAEHPMEAGADPAEYEQSVRDAVNKQAADDIWNKGSYGNGQERIDNLTKLGYDYKEVQGFVNAYVSEAAENAQKIEPAQAVVEKPAVEEPAPAEDETKAPVEPARQLEQLDGAENTGYGYIVERTTDAINLPTMPLDNDVYAPSGIVDSNAISKEDLAEAYKHSIIDFKMVGSDKVAVYGNGAMVGLDDNMKQYDIGKDDVPADQMISPSGEPIDLDNITKDQLIDMFKENAIVNYVSKDGQIAAEYGDGRRSYVDPEIAFSNETPADEAAEIGENSITLGTGEIVPKERMTDVNNSKFVKDAEAYAEAEQTDTEVKDKDNTAELGD